MSVLYVWGSSYIAVVFPNTVRPEGPPKLSLPLTHDISWLACTKALPAEKQAYTHSMYIYYIVTQGVWLMALPETCQMGFLFEQLVKLSSAQSLWLYYLTRVTMTPSGGPQGQASLSTTPSLYLYLLDILTLPVLQAIYLPPQWFMSMPGVLYHLDPSEGHFYLGEMWAARVISTGDFAVPVSLIVFVRIGFF